MSPQSQQPSLEDCIPLLSQAIGSYLLRDEHYLETLVLALAAILKVEPQLVGPLFDALLQDDAVAAVLMSRFISFLQVNPAFATALAVVIIPGWVQQLDYGDSDLVRSIERQLSRSLPQRNEFMKRLVKALLAYLDEDKLARYRLIKALKLEES